MLSLSALQQLPYEFIYIVLSLFVAVIIWYEGHFLKSTEGKVPTSGVFHIASLIDTLWFFISLICLYFLTFQSITICVPIAYIIYTLVGWVYGTILMSKEGTFDSLDSLDDLVVPQKYIAYSQSFSLIFFGLCLFTSLNLVMDMKLPFGLSF